MKYVYVIFYNQQAPRVYAIYGTREKAEEFAEVLKSETKQDYWITQFPVN